MESIVNYLEDTEKRLMMDMTNLFSKMREQRNSLALEGIEEMYSYKSVENVIYDPCLRIPCASLSGRYYYAYIRLPKDEFIIDVFSNHYQVSNPPMYADGYYCLALTNYGRLINTEPIISSRGPFDSSITDGSPTSLTKIDKLGILPYKLPSWFYYTFKNLNKNLYIFMGGGWSQSNSHSIYPSKEKLNNLASDTTNSLQELNKEFYLFAGKWQTHVTEESQRRYKQDKPSIACQVISSLKFVE